MDGHISKCMKRLKEWNAPLTGWRCDKVVDVREDQEDIPLDMRSQLSKCELCDCDKVRYEHWMVNDLYFEPVIVGCICAGIMEGDIMAAKERERAIRNRQKRRRNFVKRRWVVNKQGVFTRSYRHTRIFIRKINGFYDIRCGSKWCNRYKGKLITDMLSASYAAFELADSRRR